MFVVGLALAHIFRGFHSQLQTLKCDNNDAIA
jgi:hypothetical protein